MNTIKQNCEAVRALIEQPVATEDLDGMANYLMELKSMSGLSAANMANAKQVWREKQKKRIEQLINDDQEILTLKSLPASTINDLVKASCGAEEAQYEYADRLDKRISYVIDSVRTIISLRKAEMEKSL